MYEVRLTMTGDGEFEPVLTNVATGEILRTGEIRDNLCDALAYFADIQAEWYEEFGVPANERDMWRVKVDITLW